MFLTSAKDVAVEYKYVWCNTRSFLMRQLAMSNTVHVSASVVTLSRLLHERLFWLSNEYTKSVGT